MRASPKAWILLVTLLLTACGSLGRPGTISKGSAAYQQRVEAAMSELKKDDADLAEFILDDLIADRRFKHLAKNQRHTLLTGAAEVAIAREQITRAHDLFLRAVATGHGDGNDWLRLSELELNLGNYNAATSHLVHFVSNWPERLTEVEPEFISRVIFHDDPDSPARLELMQMLFDADWNMTYPAADAIWYMHALARIEAGQFEAARQIAKRIDRAEELVLMRIDHRFDNVIARDSEQFDVQRGAMRYLRRLADLTSAEPFDEDLSIELSATLLTSGLNEEQLLYTENLIKLARADLDPELTAEERRSLSWMLDHRATALRRLGKIDQALKVLRVARTVAARGSDRVSQALNLAVLLTGLERPDEALAEIAQLDIDDMSEYGTMVHASVRHRAALLTGDRDAADTALEHMREHRRTEPSSILVNALLDESRLDEAAAELIAMLESPRNRAKALYWVQSFLTLEPLPGDRHFVAERTALLQRADVQAAIQAVGRIEQQPIFGY